MASTKLAMCLHLQCIQTCCQCPFSGPCTVVCQTLESTHTQEDDNNILSFFIIETYQGCASKYSTQGMLSISTFISKCSHYSTKTPLPLCTLDPFLMCDYPCQLAKFLTWNIQSQARKTWVTMMDVQAGLESLLASSVVMERECVDYLCYENLYHFHTIFFTNVPTLKKPLSA